MSDKAKPFNPDTLICALEKVCERFNVTLDVRPFTRDIVIYNREGMEVCSFSRLHGSDGPANLQIGDDYKHRYSTEPQPHTVFNCAPCGSARCLRR